MCFNTCFQFLNNITHFFTHFFIYTNFQKNENCYLNTRTKRALKFYMDFLSTSALSLLKTRELDFFLILFLIRVLDVGYTCVSEVQHRIIMKGMSD